MSDLVGKNIGQYQIVEQIGQGGMATIFKARQPSIDRYVAIKILPSQFAQDPNFVKRFEHEAKAIAALEHPHILPVHDFGTEDGRPYTVMRYVEGGTLADLMGQPLSHQRIVQIIGGVARALAYAHQRGVVHRDIKPSNILIDQHGEVLLADFGIAKTMAGSGATQLTGTGNILGTPAYMAPEQAESGKVDGRSDIYSLGVVLYELLTGQPPYQAETPLAIVLMHVNDPLPPPRSIKPDIPEPLEQVVLKAMAKAPNQRFQTANEMEQALKQALRSIESASLTGEAAAPVTQPERISDTASPPAARSGKSAMGPLLIGGGILALLLCLVGSGVVIWAMMASQDEGIAEATPAATDANIQVTLPGNIETKLTPESTAELPTSKPTSSVNPITDDSGNDTIIDLAQLGGEILFEDRFDSTRNGWTTGEDEDEYVLLSNELVNGRYRMSRQAKQGAFSWEQPIAVDFDNFVLSVDAIPVEETAPFGYGLMFRASEAEYYTFLIDEGKAFSVFLFAEDKWTALVASRRMAALESNGPNQLAVKAVGPSLTFYINGVEAITIEDDTLASGSIGLALELYDKGDRATVEFDNLIVRQIDSGEEQQAVESGNIIFADYFDSDTNGWATGQFENEFSQNEVTIAGGYYTLHVNSIEPTFVEKTLPNREFSDFVLAVEATPRNADESYSYGIAFRENSEGHTYSFEIGNDGLYAIFLFNGEWNTLKDWSSTDAIRPNQTNEIAIIAKGNTFTFFVNEQELTTIVNDTLAEGEIGLIVEVFEADQSATVDFDNLVIRKP